MATYAGPDELSAQLMAVLEQKISSYSNLNARLEAAEGDRDKAIQAFMSNSDHTEAVKLRKQLETAQAKLKELAEKLTVSEDLDETAKAKIKTELDVLKEKIRKGFSAVKDVAGVGDDPNGVLEALTKLEDPTRSGRGRKPGTAGSSLPRVSCTVELINDSNKESKSFETFSAAAMFLESEVKDMQLEFAKAAGVDHQEIKSVAKPVEFKFTPNGSKTSYTVKTTPKERKKPGPRVKTDSTKSESKPKDPQELPAAS